MFHSYSITLTGVPQRLSDVYGDGVGVVNAAHDIPYRQLLFQPFDANTNDIYVGADNTVSATNNGFHVDSPSPNVMHNPVPLGPFEAGPMRLSMFWVLGTNGEHLAIAGISF